MLKKSLIIGAALLSFFLALIIVFVNLVDTEFQDELQQSVVAIAREQGLEITLGNIELKFFPSLRLSINDVSLSNAAWEDHGDMLALKTLYAEVSIMALLSGELNIKRFILVEPEITLASNAAGVGNWVLADKQKDQAVDKEAKAAKFPFALQINELLLESGKFVYKDGQTGAEYSLQVPSLSVRSTALDAPLKLDLSLIYNNTPAHIKGTLGTLDGLLAKQPLPLQMDIQLPGASLNISGQLPLEAQQKIDLQLAAQVDSLAKFGALLKQDLPNAGALSVTAFIKGAGNDYHVDNLELLLGDTDIKGSLALSMIGNSPSIKVRLSSQQVDLRPFQKTQETPSAKTPQVLVTDPSIAPEPAADRHAVNADVSWKIAALQTNTMLLNDIQLALKLVKGAGDDYRVDNLDLLLGETDIKGALAISLAGDKPFIKAQLSSQQIDLRPFQNTQATEESQATQEKTRAFATDPLPLAGLHAVNADVSWKIAALQTNTMLLSDIQLALMLQAGKLNIQPLEMSLLGGHSNMRLQLDAAKMPRMDLDFKMTQLDPTQLPVLHEQGKLSGAKTDITLQAKGSGNSIAEIMAGLNGVLLLHTGSGEILDNIDWMAIDVIAKILSILNPFTGADQHTKLECAVVHFKIKDGIATADQGIALQTGKINLSGEGSIDLKTEQLDVGIKPSARAGLSIDTGSLVGLARIGGTLLEPKIKLDTKAALTKALSVAASTAAAVGTGGISILAQKILSMNNDAPCEIALHGPGAKSDSASPKQQVQQAVGDKARQELQGIKKQAEDQIKDGVGDSLKNMFN